MLLLSHFHINIQKIEIKISSKFSEINFVHLRFSYMNFFSLTFYFSICVSCLFPAHPVMFTSCHLYFPHVIEYLWLLIWLEEVIILFRPTFTIVLANHSNACKIVCILFPDCQSYFNFLHPSWVSLNSQRIRIDTQICST